MDISKSFSQGTKQRKGVLCPLGNCCEEGGRKGRREGREGQGTRDRIKEGGRSAQGLNEVHKRLTFPKMCRQNHNSDVLKLCPVELVFLEAARNPQRLELSVFSTLDSASRPSASPGRVPAPLDSGPGTLDTPGTGGRRAQPSPTGGKAGWLQSPYQQPGEDASCPPASWPSSVGL